MSANHLRKFQQGLILLIALVFTGSAFAVSRIIDQEDAIEATEIHVFKSGSTGTVRVDGCDQCPVTLTIDANTRFFFEGKPADNRRVTFLSGKPGTVIYDKDTSLVHRIRW